MKLTNEIIEELEKDIQEQTRNGREDVYIDVDILNELGYGIDPNKTGKVYVDVRYLKIALERYKFKGNLKVIPKQKTFKELEQEILEIERGEKEDV